MTNDKTSSKAGKISVISALVLSTGLVGFINFYPTKAETFSVNSSAKGESCKLSSGAVGITEDVILNSPYAYSNNEIKSGTKTVFELASNTKIKVKTNLGLFETTIPDLDSAKAKKWYNENGKDSLDVGDTCTAIVNDANNKVVKKGYDGISYTVMLPENKAKFNKYDNGEYSYTSKFKDVKQRESNGTLTATIPAQYIKGDSAKVNLNVAIQSKLSNVKVTKTDSKGNPLIGHKFKLISTLDNIVYSSTLTTNSDGIALFTKVPTGEYQLKETERPDDYKPKSIVRKITTSNTTVKTNILIKDSSAKGEKIKETSENNPNNGTNPDDYVDIPEQVQTGELSEDGSDYSKEEDVDPSELGEIDDESLCMFSYGDLSCAETPNAEETKIIEEMLENDRLTELQNKEDEKDFKEVEDNIINVTDDDDTNDGTDLDDDNLTPEEKQAIKDKNKKQPKPKDKETNKDKSVESKDKAKKDSVDKSDEDEKSKILPKTGSEESNLFNLFGILSLMLSTLVIVFTRKSTNKA